MAVTPISIRIVGKARASTPVSGPKERTGATVDRREATEVRVVSTGVDALLLVRARKSSVLIVADQTCRPPETSITPPVM